MPVSLLTSTAQGTKQQIKKISKKVPGFFKKMNIFSSFKTNKKDKNEENLD
jgi:hypothetical protein